jgi:hypothetical protein
MIPMFRSLASGKSAATDFLFPQLEALSQIDYYRDTAPKSVKKKVALFTPSQGFCQSRKP